MAEFLRSPRETMGILIQIGFLAAASLQVTNGQEGMDIYHSPNPREISPFFSVHLSRKTVGSSHSFHKPSFLEIKGLAYIWYSYGYRLSGGLTYELDIKQHIMARVSFSIYVEHRSFIPYGLYHRVPCSEWRPPLRDRWLWRGSFICHIQCIVVDSWWRSSDIAWYSMVQVAHNIRSPCNSHPS